MPPVPERTATGSPGLPGFRSWRRVYVAVLVVFILVVAALTWFSRFFS